MFEPRRSFTAALVLGLFLSAGASGALAETAQDLYMFHCAQCHGLKGMGDGPNATKEMPVTPRDHTSALEMGKLTDGDIISAITDGGTATSKSSLMPPFGKTLSKQEIVSLKDYLRKLCNCKGR
ncbi:MAG: cytochrome c [Deltaproteobacteria bacterium]|nr:cytochrome c [Deltaproteobacteria bacterium]